MQEVIERHTPDRRPSSSFVQSRSVYASTPFKFIVEGTAFFLHAGLVSHHSRPLDRMINGDMSEAQKGYAVLEGVEEDTFARFAEWAYQGYYTSAVVIYRLLDDSGSEKSLTEDGRTEKRAESPHWTPQPAEELLEEDEPPESLVSRSKRLKAPRNRTRKAVDLASSWEESPISKTPSKLQLKESFIHRKAIVRRESIGIPPPRPNQESEEDYTDVFLSYAQLYVFAEKYDIQTLKTLALENLQNVLAIFTLYEERTGDIIALLRYVYMNTSELIDGHKEMRTLLTHYVGYEMDTLMKDEEFRDLMIADGGELLGDFMKMVMKRIS